MRTTPIRIAIFGLLAALIPITTSHAHPLGNSSITHFNVIYVLPDRLEVDLLLDFAETPAAEIRRNEIDTNKDDKDSEEERQAWLEKRAVEYASFLAAKVDGQPIAMQPLDEAYDRRTGKKSPVSRQIVMLPGFAHMPTYRVLIRYGGAYPRPLGAGEHTITYEENTYPQEQGLQRILLEQTPQAEFYFPRPAFWNEGPDPFIYEQYDIAKLPQERGTTLRFRLTPEALAAETQPAAASALRAPITQTAPPTIIDSFTDPRNNPAQTEQSYRQAKRLIGLLQGRWGLAMLLAVTGLSFIWGAAHALMPGHAKTVVAAYLISQHGTYRHAVLLAVIVTVTHTALVVLLGLVIWIYQGTNPTLGPRIQLWLGLIAGLLVAIMGVSLVWRALTGRIAHHHHDHDHHEHQSWFQKLFTHSHPHPHHHHHDHDHAHDHPHHHHHEHGHTHDHGHEHHHHEHEDHHHHDHPHIHEHHHPPAAALSTKMLLMLGITGGIVPCPTAMIIMLLGIGANVVLGALYAVGIFSLGLALTLMVIGFLALSSRRFASKLLTDAEHEGELSNTGQKLMLQVIPALSGGVVVALGLAITAHYIYMIETGRILFGWLG